jgi:hypothetical protein
MRSQAANSKSETVRPAIVLKNRAKVPTAKVTAKIGMMLAASSAALTWTITFRTVSAHTTGVAQAGVLA